MSTRRELSSKAEAVSLLGVEYVRHKTLDGGDLYLTRFGAPFWEQLVPESWYAAGWFSEQRVRLEGTSVIYRVPTKVVNGISLELVVRFSRVGQEVPLDPVTHGKNIHAEFNSPFEEFGLVMKLRTKSAGSSRPRILTKRPLAIYVPAKEFQDWQLGRLESKLAAKMARHPEIKLDRSREYILLYGWIDGLNAVEATEALGMTDGSAEKFLAETTLRVIEELQHYGFRMLDIKPQHVVLRIRADGSLLQTRGGKLAYALVDYELLEHVGELGGSREYKSDYARSETFVR